MNGDYLSQLKKPLRSEMNRHVIGTNKAVTTLMNKRLDLYFKDKNIALEKIRRRQEDVYGTMLRVLKEKKILQRTTYKRRQEEIWQTINKPAGGKRKADVLQLENGTPKEVDSTEQPNNVDNCQNEEKAASNGSGDVGNDQLCDSYASKEVQRPIRTYERRAKVLEVTKKSPLAPITRERSDIRKEPNVDGKENNSNHLLGADPSTFPNIGKRLDLLPGIKLMAADDAPVSDERSATDLIIESVSRAQRVSDAPVPEDDVLGGSPSGSYQFSPRRFGRDSPPMPPISESSRNLRPPAALGGDQTYSEAVDGKNRDKDEACDNDEAPTPIPTIGEQSGHAIAKYRTGSNDNYSGEQNEKTKKGLSLAERNRRRAAARLRRRHEELQSEPLTIYVKDNSGNYVPSNTEFKRRQFQPPSSKEKYFQKKMLRAQMEARLEQQRKLEAFFERMAAEGKVLALNIILAG